MLSFGQTVDGSEPPRQEVRRRGAQDRMPGLVEETEQVSNSCTNVLRPVVPRKLPLRATKLRSLAIITSASSMSLLPMKQRPSCQDGQAVVAVDVRAVDESALRSGRRRA